MRLQVSDQFWGSTVVGELGARHAGTAEVATRCLEDVLAAHRANVLVMDIEGLEVDIMEEADLRAIEKMIVEIHYERTGRQRTNKAVFGLAAKGFEIDLKHSSRGVLLLTRDAA